MRCLLLACALAALIAPPANAASRVQADRLIALNTIGNVCDVGTMNVPIIRTAGLPYAAYATWTLSEPFTGCAIYVDDRPWSNAALCTVLAHEFVHLTGYRLPAGQEYIAADGTPDYLHSRDPRSLMWPFALQPWPPCERTP
jgi:hypothetical protein